MAYGGTPCLSSSHLRLVAGLIRSRRKRIGSRWRVLSPGGQALAVLTHLRRNHTLSQVAADHDIGVATVFRYVREVIDLLAALAPSVTGGVWQAAACPEAIILDGMCVPIDRYRDAARDPDTGKRVANDSHYCGKHKRFCVNLQALATRSGDMLWISTGLPGSVHDLTAARVHGILGAARAAGVRIVADTAYTGAGANVIVGHKHRKGIELSGEQQAHNRHVAWMRSPGERIFAIAKTWRILTRYRASRLGATAQAICTLTRHYPR